MENSQLINISKRSTRQYPPSPICKMCGGLCCQASSGIMHPDQCDALDELLDSGDYSIDWWDGDPRPNGGLSQVYFIRPRHVGVEKLLDPSWGGTCVFLSGRGCTLSRDEMPLQCRALRPRETLKGDCKGTLTKEKMAWIWTTHQAWIVEYIERYRNGR